MEKKIVIWGIGDRSRAFSKLINELPEFYLDNDISKDGTTFFGRPVVHPSRVDNWEDYKIIIANSFYDEIKEQLLSYGLEETKDFVFYGNIVNNKAKLKKLMEDSEKWLDNVVRENGQHRGKIMVFGAMLSFDKNSHVVFNNFVKHGCDNFLVVSENNAAQELDKQGLVHFQYICLPLLFWANFHLQKGEINAIDVPEEIMTYIYSNECLANACEDFKAKNRADIEDGFAEYMVYSAEKFLDRFLAYFKPQTVFMWNQFYPFHQILAYVCKKQGIDIAYMEYGAIPGTYHVEHRGQMGESTVAVNWNEFQELPISPEEIENARKIRQYLKKSGLNRKPQPQNNAIEQIKKKLRPDKPVIVFTGQNDYESGMYPYTEKAQKYHSPVFSSSGEAAISISQIAAKNGWNFIYKPHPICVVNDAEIESMLAEGSIYVSQCDINALIDIADLHMTILSTTAYISLIREKATMLLGYIQLRGKGCTYEAFSYREIEGEMFKALACGYTKEQRSAFDEHIARMVKYYCYDDNSSREIRYGKELLDLPKDYRNF